MPLSRSFSSTMAWCRWCCREQTWKVLFSLDVVDAHGVPKPSSTPAPIPYFVEVDVANQLIKVFGLDENLSIPGWKGILVLYRYPDYPSTPGTYTLTKRRSPWALFPNWGGGTAPGG